MATLETRTVETDEAGMRLDRWFKSHYPELSFGHLQKLLRSGQIRVDGGRVKTNARLAPGQAVRVPPLGQGGLAGILRESKPASDEYDASPSPERAGSGERSTTKDARGLDSL